MRFRRRATRRRQHHHALFDRRQRGQCGQQYLHAELQLWCRLVAEGTGVLLNNELDDFTAAPGASNSTVSWDSRPTCPARQTPIVLDVADHRPERRQAGSGDRLTRRSRIISAVLQVIVDVLDYGMDVAAAVAAPRVHHQWLPDEVRVERGFPDDTLAALRAKGHRVVEPLSLTSANSIAVTRRDCSAPLNPRTRGAEAAGQ